MLLLLLLLLLLPMMLISNVITAAACWLFGRVWGLHKAAALTVAAFVAATTATALCRN